MILISILVITYNQEQFISQTLNSILNQDGISNFEIIVSDDCSKDSTRNIIHDYADKYPSIIKPVYNKENLGLIRNYFNGIKHCTGKYIMQCAGDDFWFPEKVKNQITFMEQNVDIGMCYGKVKCIDEKGNYTGEDRGLNCSSFEMMIEGNTVPAVTVCIRKSIFDNYIQDIQPEVRNWKMEDYPAWLWMSKNSKIAFIDDYFGAYRIMTESASRSINFDKQFSFEESTYQIRKFYGDLYGVKVYRSIKDKVKSFLLSKKLIMKIYKKIKKVQ